MFVVYRSTGLQDFNGMVHNYTDRILFVDNKEEAEQFVRKNRYYEYKEIKERSLYTQTFEELDHTQI